MIPSSLVFISIKQSYRKDKLKILLVNYQLRRKSLPSLLRFFRRRSIIRVGIFPPNGAERDVEAKGKAVGESNNDEFYLKKDSKN